MDKVRCDYCLNRINDTDEEISAVMLEVNNAKHIFCDDDCLKGFICECSWDVYVTPNGHIVD